MPTVCLALLQHLEATELRLTHLRLIVVGGSACPPSTIQARLRACGHLAVLLRYSRRRGKLSVCPPSQV